MGVEQFSDFLSLGTIEEASKKRIFCTIMVCFIQREHLSQDRFGFSTLLEVVVETHSIFMHVLQEKLSLLMLKDSSREILQKIRVWDIIDVVGVLVMLSGRTSWTLEVEERVDLGTLLHVGVLVALHLLSLAVDSVLQSPELHVPQLLCLPFIALVSTRVELWAHLFRLPSSLGVLLPHSRKRGDELWALGSPPDRERESLRASAT